MDIKQSFVISSGEKPEDKPDAVKIEVLGMTALVNLHTGVVTIDGAAHAEPTAGHHNTLEIHICPQVSGLKRIGDLLGGISESIIPGMRIMSVGDFLDDFPFRR